jgi:hypothetical protein
MVKKLNVRMNIDITHKIELKPFTSVLLIKTYYTIFKLTLDVSINFKKFNAVKHY